MGNHLLDFKTQVHSISNLAVVLQQSEDDTKALRIIKSIVPVF